MKRYNNRKIRLWAVMFLLPMLVIGCLKIDDIIQPNRALVDSQIEVTVKIRVSPAEDKSGKVVFAMLAPKSLNLRENATPVLTTIDYEAIQMQPEVVNEQLTPMPGTETEPQTGRPWSEAFMQVVGMGANDGTVEMEWTVWRSSTTFNIRDKINDVETEDVHAEVKITLQTGSDPVACELGYSYCYDNFGLKREEKPDDNRFAEAFRSIEIYDQIFITEPEAFRYGDVFSITFAHRGTALRDAESIYLCGTAVYNGGQKAEITAAGQKNSMVRTGSRFEKYLYAKEFFGLPSDAAIESLSFYFINADGSIVVRDEENGGVEFFVPQSEK